VTITEPASAIGFKTDGQLQIYTHKADWTRLLWNTLSCIDRVCTQDVLITLSAIDLRCCAHTTNTYLASILFQTSVTSTHVAIWHVPAVTQEYPKNTSKFIELTVGKPGRSYLGAGGAMTLALGFGGGQAVAKTFLPLDPCKQIVQKKLSTRMLSVKQ